ncbi:MAG: type II toxin-antitoxin system VapC family toxin [Candidatus Hydrogenedentes bacterium]|nr:type II toxin-antitoxin system VapC family toxin [Candidatus Hydrogenedentota bacterium]
MNLLLDTHAAVWFLEGNDKLRPTARQFIGDPNNNSFVSIVSLWEVGIKLSASKLELKSPFEEVFPGELDRNGIALLRLEIAHIARATSLPFYHRDPFDRMLVAQCLVEGLSIVSADAALDAYGVSRFW